MGSSPIRVPLTVSKGAVLSSGPKKDPNFENSISSFVIFLIVLILLKLFSHLD